MKINLSLPLRVLLGFIIAAFILIILNAIGIANSSEKWLEDGIIFLILWTVVTISVNTLKYVKKPNLLKGLLNGVIASQVILFALFLSEKGVDFRVVSLLYSAVIPFLIRSYLNRFFNTYKWLIIGCYGFVSVAFFVLTPTFFNQNPREIYFMLIFNSSILLIILWFWDKRIQFKKITDDKASAELQMLKNQINPHFFFNTLNSLYALIKINQDDAREMVLKISDLMRYTLYETNTLMVSIRDEISYISNYLDLYKIRFQRNANIEFIVDIKDDLRVPPLIFIIPIENAFKHGIENNASEGSVSIEIGSSDDKIVLTVINSFDYAPDNEESNGLGIDNIMKRLSLIYGDQFEYSVHKSEDTYKFQLILPSYV